MVSLVDTNVLVYRYDGRYPAKRDIARDLLRQGLVKDSVRIPHQAILEFVSAATRSKSGDPPLLTYLDAMREAEEILNLFTVLYPNSSLLQIALRGAAAYRLSWFDAHLWAYAEHYGLDEIISEEFEHGRLYGTVRVRNPFL